MKTGPTKEDLVYRTSRWQKVLYDGEREATPRLKENERRGEKRNPRFADYQREVFSRLYNPKTPKMDEPAEGSDWADRLHNLAEEVTEFGSLQQQVKGDEIYSGMAAANIARSVCAKMKPQPTNENLEKLQENIDSLKDLAEHGVPVQDRIDKDMEKLERAKKRAKQQAEGLDPSKLRKAIRDGSKQAQQEVSELDSELQAMTYGNTYGTPKAHGNSTEKRALSQYLATHPKVRNIAKMAGRLRRVAGEKQRSKSDYAREEVGAVEQGNDPDRLLPCELAQLVSDVEEQELLFFSRFADRQTLQYELKGKEAQGRGPIIIAMDESGSMRGNPECWSKAVALALLDIARRQKRSWVFIHFDSSVQRVDVIKKGQVDQADLMECLMHFSGGGTDFEDPLREAIKQIREDGEFKKADVLLVTDGCSQTGDKFNRWYAEQAQELEITTYTVLVNGVRVGPAVSEWSQHVYTLEELITSNKGRAFEDVVFSM